MRLTRSLFMVVLALITFVACSGIPTPTDVPAAPVPPTLGAANAPDILTPTDAPRASSTPTPTTTSPTRGATPTRTVTLTPIVIRTPSHDLAALNEYQRGIAYTTLSSGAYVSPESDHSLDELFATGANYISLLVTWYQDNYLATNIARTANTPTDDDLLHVINYAHAHGVHVLLKPQVDFSNDPDHWRGQIEFKSESDWRAWFDSYRQFILYYARFAQKSGVEEFSVGTELYATTARTSNWRDIIRAVRAEYSGLLTYSANHSGEEVQVNFWDALDFIGVNNFYHLTNYRKPTLAQLLEAWKLPVLQLSRLHDRFPNQPIIFTEVGYPSLDRANVWPWNWYHEGDVDLQAQYDCYDALFRTFWKNPERPWFRGLFIWNWTADPNQGGANDRDYTPHNKPAESLLSQWFHDDPNAKTPAATPTAQKKPTSAGGMN